MRWDDLRRRLRPHLLWIGVAMALAAYAIMLWRLPPPEMWLLFDGQAEAMRYRVIDPHFASIRLPGASFTTEEGVDYRCVDVVITPAEQAEISYRRASEELSIIIDPPEQGRDATLVDIDRGEMVSARHPLIVSVGECPNAPIPTLPIWGPADFGDLARPAGPTGASLPGTLVQGTITAYARSHDRLLGMALPRTIYKVESIDLPSGALVRGLDPTDPLAPLWTGRVDIGGSNPGFHVRASSEARNIFIAPPNGAPAATRPYRINLGAYPQYLRDPNLVQVQFLIAAFLFLANGSRSLLRWLLGTPKGDDHPANDKAPRPHARKSRVKVGRSRKGQSRH